MLPDDLSARKFIQTLRIWSATSDATTLDIGRLEDFYYLICDWVKEIMEDLPELEKGILAMRFGIGEFDRVHTLEEVAVKFEVTRERVRQIEAKAYARLRHPHNAAKLLAILDNEERSDTD